MTNDDRELAEWVARWAGYGVSANGRLMVGKGETFNEATTLLCDPALAWRALVELTQITADFLLFKKGIDGWIGEWFMPRKGTVAECAARPEIVVFRALRAAKEKECD